MIFTKKEELNGHIKKIKVDDLRVGMYVDRLDSSWLSSPLIMSNFSVVSEREVTKLREYDIRHVYIDITKGKDIGESAEVCPVNGQLQTFETFEVDLDDFWMDSRMPVDLYRNDDGRPDLILKKGMTLSSETIGIFKSIGVSCVSVPCDQKADFDRYLHEIEGLKRKRRDSGYVEEFLSPMAVEAHLAFMTEYHPINVNTLKPGEEAPFDIYIRVRLEIRLGIPKGQMLQEEEQAMWVEHDVNILIRRDDIAVYQLFLEERSKAVKDGKVKAAIIRENSKLIIESLAGDPRSEKLMERTKDSACDLIEMVMENPTTYYAMMKINNYDYYTFTHSVNVSTLSIALGMAAGITSKSDLSDLALGALLHDVGKSRVDQTLLNKPGSLTDTEFASIKSHVTKGYEMLRWNKSVSAKALIPLVQHHEKINGKGYPSGLAGDQIHLFGRITALIDIYDALTTERVYRKAMKPFDALALMSKTIEGYDAALFRLLVTLIHSQNM